MITAREQSTEPSLLTILERVAAALLLVAICSACAIVLHKSVHFIARAPALNIDDSIPNVAVSLAQRGRYGFLASPTQGATEVDRTRAFFNYGPLYFYVSAALTWVAKPSVMLYRMLHPAGLVLVVLLAAWTLRHTSLTGAAVLAVLLFDMYFEAHWPLARPDIMVSVCAALVLTCASRAIDTGDPWSWLAVGFFAGNALTTHQIAASVVLAAAMMWLWGLPLLRADGPDRFKRRALTSAAALAAGGIAAACVYLVAIRFRVADVLALGNAGMSAYARPFTETLASHYAYAWSSMPVATRRWLIAAFIGAATLSVFGLFMREPLKRLALSKVMPPVVLAMLYQLSLGFYGNNHSGYVILSQVATLWAVGALVSVVVAWVRPRFGAAGRSMALAAAVIAVVSVGRADARWLRTTGLWEGIAAGNVDIDDFIRQSMAPLPERAPTWGSLYFGLQSGDRLDLVQFLEMFRVVFGDFTQSARARVAPDFLLLSNYETDLDFTRYLSGRQTLVEQFFVVLDGLQYRLARLLYAPPYGVVRTYQRGAESNGQAPGGVVVNDGTTRQWSSRLVPVPDARFVPSAPSTVHVNFYGINVDRRAVMTLATTLPRGFYLVDVALDRPAPDRVGFVIATSARHLFWRGGWTQFAVPAAPYLPGEHRVQLLVDHLGGALYVGRFENALDMRIRGEELWTSMIPGKVQRKAEWGDPTPASAYGMRVTAVHQVDVLTDGRERATPPRTLNWDGWTRDNPGTMSFDTLPEGSMHVAGTSPAGGRLLTSPIFRLARGQRVVIAIPADLQRGAVGAGIAGADGWLVPPIQMPRRIAYEAAADIDVSIVIVNNPVGEGTTAFDASLGPLDVTFAAAQELYVDRLMRCRPAVGPKPDDCPK